MKIAEGNRDFEGYINTNFKADVISTILEKSILNMFNGLRIKKLIADLLNFSNTTTVPKKGSILDPENERGIFRVSVIRSILMRII